LKYLIYLIGYEIISYNGQKRKYAIENGGLDLMGMILKEKKTMNVDGEDILIILE
jgi:hypothetical protein